MSNLLVIKLDAATATTTLYLTYSVETEMLGNLYAFLIVGLVLFPSAS